ncbi:AP-2 complex subunit beta-like isoform X1 [Manis pentadactyla]|uniref:AP-2 complex subunit beta-like isoform X1 n=1 Tax=Manis pentadactyla TaxID=143292 RepID=UPI00255C66A7|nr:AP-2 complex subunit beta-like isoform X1 [Manis pentadactyla]XP_057357187.1 AP-2 complex subunit beta-like isoform X1 [Manis pentadactyla]
MTDSKYFTTNKKGEIFELKAELNNEKKEKRKEAVKKVIAAMTVGKDVSSLFPDVVNCMQTDNLELKKLVYLYLMNYAKSQPDMAIMAVNSFVKSSRMWIPVLLKRPESQSLKHSACPTSPTPPTSRAPHNVGLYLQSRSPGLGIHQF